MQICSTTFESKYKLLSTSTTSLSQKFEISLKKSVFFPFNSLWALQWLTTFRSFLIASIMFVHVFIIHGQTIFNQFSPILSKISASSNLSHMHTFLILSLNVLPLIHLNILIFIKSILKYIS